MLCNDEHQCASAQYFDTHPAIAEPNGYSPPPSDHGCPPTELTCTVPAPLTKVGRNQYQKDGWVKPAPVTARHTIGMTTCGAVVRITGQCPNIDGAGSGIWNFVKHNWLPIVTISAALACTFITRGGSKASICDITAEDAFSVNLKYTSKIRDQMGPRGWTEDSIADAVDNPVETHLTWDYTSGNKLPATAYVSSNGGYVVVNDETGEIVQVSNLNKHAWKPVWNDPWFQR